MKRRPIQMKRRTKAGFARQRAFTCCPPSGSLRMHLRLGARPGARLACINHAMIQAQGSHRFRSVCKSLTLSWVPCAPHTGDFWTQRQPGTANCAVGSVSQCIPQRMRGGNAAHLCPEAKVSVLLPELSAQPYNSTRHAWSVRKLRQTSRQLACQWGGCMPRLLRLP